MWVLVPLYNENCCSVRCRMGINKAVVVMHGFGPTKGTNSNKGQQSSTKWLSLSGRLRAKVHTGNFQLKSQDTVQPHTRSEAACSH